MNIVVTAGGVTERIDSVRKIANSSSGKLGVMIANLLASKYPDANVTLIGTDHAFKENSINIRINKIRVESTEDLDREVTLLLCTSQIDIFVHAMAVADYTVDAVIDFDRFSSIIEGECSDVSKAIEESKIDASGKISSDRNIMLKMEQTEKVIHKIKQLSPRTFLVGFKLLDDISNEELFEIGFDLLRKNRCNLVIANDISKIRNGEHEALLIYPERSYDELYGKENIAKALVDRIDKRAFVKHIESISCDYSHLCDEEHFYNNNMNDIFHSIKEVGERLYYRGYLPEVIDAKGEKNGTYGNISVRMITKNMMITGRNVHKGKLTPNDVAVVESVVKNVKEDDNVYAKVYYKGIKKPSIDAAIHEMIYRNTRTEAIIHIHTNRVFLGYPYVDKQFPCGSKEERDAICKTLHESYNSLGDHYGVYIVQMKKHGLIIAGPNLDVCMDKLNDMFRNDPYINKDAICDDVEVQNHIKEVHSDFVGMKGSHLYNLELYGETIGCVWEKEDENVTSFGVYTKRKGLGIVEKYLKMHKKVLLYTTTACGVEDFYKTKYGFSDCYRNGDLIILTR